MSEQEPIEQEGDGLVELTAAFHDALGEIERGAIDPGAVRGGASFSVAETSTTLYLRVALAPGATDVPKPAVSVRDGGLWVDGILICEVADIPSKERGADDFRDKLITTTEVRLGFRDRLRVLVKGRLTVHSTIQTENEVGRTQTESASTYVHPIIEPRATQVEAEVTSPSNTQS